MEGIQQRFIHNGKMKAQLQSMQTGFERNNVHQEDTNVTNQQKSFFKRWKSCLNSKKRKHKI